MHPEPLRALARKPCRSLQSLQNSIACLAPSTRACATPISAHHTSPANCQRRIGPTPGPLRQSLYTSQTTSQIGRSGKRCSTALPTQKSYTCAGVSTISGLLPLATHTGPDLARPHQSSPDGKDAREASGVASCRTPRHFLGPLRSPGGTLS